jgi:lactoylglutathione lyase
MDGTQSAGPSYLAHSASEVVATRISFEIADSYAPKPDRSPLVTAPRPFRVLGIQQIAVGGLDKGRLRKLWIDTLGLTRTGEFRSERENVDEDIAVAGSGPLKVEVDLMQPLDPAKSPKVHDPALNHVGLWIDDLHAAVAWLEAAGVRFTPGGIRKGAAGFDVCFIHPKGNEAAPIGGEGVLIELVQAPPEVVAAFGKLAS